MIKNIVQWFSVPKHRAYVYGVTEGALLLMSGLGWITTENVALWLAFLPTVLVVDLARRNVPKDED